MSEGLIRRSDAIKAINLRVRMPHDVTSAYYASMAINAIRSLPSADRPQGWIPCSERLPSESGSYLVTVPMDNGDSYVDALDYHKGKFYEYDSEWGDIEYDDVLAWMPLPKPYGEREGE